MGQTLTHGIYLPDEGERNCYNGLAANWSILDGAVGTIAEHTTALAGKAPASHTHGNLTNDGKIGTTANVPLITGTDGVVQAGSFGNAANTFCEGNDSRLSDARTPVAHTHTKSDVTDLLNSNFIPSSDGSYTLGSSDLRWKQIWANGYKTKSGNIDFTDSATTGSRESWWVDAMEKNGTSFFGVGSIRSHSSGINSEHFRIKNAGGKWADLYIQLTDDNQFSIGITNHSDVTNIGFRGKFVPLGSFIPYVNNYYDLGSSSYQWNNLYAKNYYYNGVAWGLDKANVWSAENTFTSNNINIQRPFILGDNTYQIARLQVLDSASTPQRLGTFNFVHHNNNLSRLEIGIYGLNSNNEINNKFLLFQLEPDNTSSFFPLNNSQINLGTSTNKWKSLNGINPGALSLPNLNYSDSNQWIDISGNITKFTGGDNWYYPAVDGWVFVITKDNPVSLNVLVLGAVNSNKLIAGASGVLEASSGAMWVSSPAPAGSRVRIRANNGSTGTIEAAWFITCQGNV